MTSTDSRAGAWIRGLLAFGALAVVGVATLAMLSASWRGFGPPGLGDRPLGDLAVVEEPRASEWGDVLEADSGSLVVAENRSDADSSRIAIAYHRLRSTSPDPGAPILVLAGGPGTSGIELGDGDLFYVFRALVAHADVVLVDQRGTGRSVPRLECGESLDLPTDIDSEIESTLLSAIREKVGRCLDRLRAAGIDVAAYQSAESADDLDELRTALGYERWTILGFSYGTELANVYARRHPERVERMILIGPTAPDLALKLPSGAGAELAGLAHWVARDPLLSRRIPDFGALVRRVHERLRTEPAKVDVPLTDAIDESDPAPLKVLFEGMSLFRPSWGMTMGDFHLQLLLVDALGEDAALERIPALYDQMDRGEYRAVGNRLRNFRRRDIPRAILFTTSCATGFTPERWELAGVESESAALSRAALSFARDDASCAQWKLPRTHPELLEPEGTDRPVLMVAGDLDGLTPIANARALEGRYSDHRTIVVRGRAHRGLLTGEVVRGIEAFLEGEEPTVLEVERTLELEPPVESARDLAADVEAAYRESLEAGDALLRSRLEEQRASAEYLDDFRESTLNRLGYRLLRRHLGEAALTVFRLNAELHPLSYNVWDSLAEGELRAEQREAAQEHYRRSLELEPTNGNAWRMLERMERGEQ